MHMPHAACPYDFTTRRQVEVTAVKLSQLFAIQRHDLIDVIEHVGKEDADSFLAALAKEQSMVLDALKVNRKGKKAEAAAAPETKKKEKKSVAIVEPEAAPSSEPPAPPRAKPPRRRPSFNVGLTSGPGSLLQGGKNGSTGAGSSETVSATLSLWEEAADAMKTQTHSLEVQARTFQKEVRGCSKGMGSIEQLLAALQLVPDGERPKRASADDAGGAGGAGGGGDPSTSASSGEPPDGGRAAVDSVSPLRGVGGAGGTGNRPGPVNLAAVGASSSIEPDLPSGSRLLDDLSKMFQGFRQGGDGADPRAAAAASSCARPMRITLPATDRALADPSKLVETEIVDTTGGNLTA